MKKQGSREQGAGEKNHPDWGGASLRDATRTEKPLDK